MVLPFLLLLVVRFWETLVTFLTFSDRWTGRQKIAKVHIPIFGGELVQRKRLDRSSPRHKTRHRTNHNGPIIQLAIPMFRVRISAINFRVRIVLRLNRCLFPNHVRVAFVWLFFSMGFRLITRSRLFQSRCRRGQSPSNLRLFARLFDLVTILRRRYNLLLAPKLWCTLCQEIERNDYQYVS